MVNDELRERFRKIAGEVLPFGLKAKQKMQAKQLRRARVKCPNPAHTETKYVWASLNGPRDHIHFGCEDPDCYYRMME